MIGYVVWEDCSDISIRTHVCLQYVLNVLVEICLIDENRKCYEILYYLLI